MRAQVWARRSNLPLDSEKIEITVIAAELRPARDRAHFREVQCARNIPPRMPRATAAA